MSDLLRAVESFQAPGHFVAKGDEVHASDPIVAGREHLFEPVPPPKPKRSER